LVQSASTSGRLPAHWATSSGQVDDLRIYGRGLSPAEVAELASGA